MTFNTECNILREMSQNRQTARFHLLHGIYNSQKQYNGCQGLGEKGYGKVMVKWS